MNITEYNYFTNKPTTISVQELSYKHEGTLLYGYTCGRDSFHVYIKDGLIHKYIYSLDTNIYHNQLDVWNVEDLVPNKRVYPAASDFGFCKLLTQRGVNIPYTTFEERPEQVYYGKVYEG